MSPSAPSSVFISYNHQDVCFARSLRDNLVKAGFAVWLDEGAMWPGQELSETIEKAIIQSDHLIVVISISSVGSAWVRQEVEQFRSKKGGTSLIPVTYEVVHLPDFLQNILCADFTDNRRFSQSFAQLLHGLDPGQFPLPFFVTHEDLQYLLDKMPVPKLHGLFSKPTTDQEMAEYYSANSLDIMGMVALTGWPAAKLEAAMRELVSNHQIEVILIKNADDPKPNFPLFFKGGIDPGIRASPEELETVLRAFAPRRQT
jgi:hypothetical protein